MGSFGRAVFVLCAACVGVVGCGDGGNFSQYPGFDKLRAQRGKTPPTPDEQMLLIKHRPRLFIAANAEPPLDFYKDYIAAGDLYDGDGELTATHPDAKTLNAHRHDEGARFVHRSNGQPPSPVAYGGILRADLRLPEIGLRRLTFLTYHFVFRVSGLPAGLGDFLRGVANAVGDADDWHQLDHYTAVFIVLDGEQPIAVMLQQHNFMRTYLLDENSPFDAAIAVDAAISSNELYPHSKQKKAHRTAGFVGKKTVGYLAGVEDKSGWTTSLDITHGVVGVDYELQFLPPNDAFYVFEGYLGEQRWLPGGDGPPGAMYRTSPKYCPPQVALYTFYWRDQDADYARIFRAMDDDEQAAETALKLRFAQALKKVLKDESADESTGESAGESSTDESSTSESSADES